MLKIYRIIWKYMGNIENIEIYRRMWKHMKTYENIWKIIETY